MNIALSEQIMKCVSTDTLRIGLRTFDQREAVHRSSYSGQGNPALEWLETSNVLDPTVHAVVDDSIKRRTSLVLEGVHIVPSPTLINKWISAGGQGVGILLVVSDYNAHRELIHLRGKFARKPATAQLEAFHRIRSIQEHMISLASLHGWLQIEQDLTPDPVDIVSNYFTTFNKPH
jgi:2-phosphoglycerate kinase